MTADGRSFFERRMKMAREKWLLKINYQWYDGGCDEEPDQVFDSPEDAFDMAKRMAVEEARTVSLDRECDIPLRFYNQDMCKLTPGCEGAYAVIDLIYSYDTVVDINGLERQSSCRYIVIKQ